MTPEQQLEEQRRLQAIKEAQERNESLAIAEKQDEQAVQNSLNEELDAEMRAAGPALEAETASPEREEGIVSQIGNTVASFVSGDWVADTLDAIAPDTFKSADELKKEQAQRITQRADSGNILDKAGAEVERNLLAVEQGVLATPMLPFSAAAGLTGQKQVWNEAPEVVKDTFVSKAVYDITKVAVPTLFAAPLVTAGTSLAGLATGTRIAVSGGKILAAESLIETVANQDPDDYILSRTAARSVGELVNAMGGDGGDVTRRLLEGDGILYRTAGGVAGFLHNLGINKAAGSIFSRIGKVVDNARIEKLSKQSGKSPEEVQQIVNTTKEPVYSIDREPIESGTVDGVANVIAGDTVDNAVSPMGFLSAIIEKADDLRTNPFFLHLDGLTGGDMGFVRAIDALTQSLPRFADIDVVRGQAAITGLKFLTDNADLFPSPTQDFLENVGENLLRGANLDKLKTGEIKTINQEILKGSAVLPEGIIVSGVAMKELNQRVIALSRTIQTSDSSGIDWTESLPVMRQLMEANETWANIYRHAQQQWNVGGTSLQYKFRQALMTGIGLDKFFKKGQKDIYGSADDMFKMAEGTVMANKHVTDVIDQAIAGDQQALNSIRELTAIMATESADRPMMMSTLTSDTFRKNFYEGTGSDLGMAYYGQSLLGNYGVATAATAATGFRVTLQPALAAMGAFPTMLQIAPKRAFQVETYLDHLSLYSGAVKMLGQAARVSRQALAQNVPIMQGKTRWGSTIQSLGQQAAERKIKYKAYKDQLVREGKQGSIEDYFATMAFWTRTTLTSPALHITTRLLMASDEGFKVMAGGSWASFKTHRKALEAGRKLTRTETDEIFKEELLKVFNDGDPMKGFVMGTEALELSNAFTFQRDIPVNQEGIPFVELGFGKDSSERGINIGSLTANTFGTLEDAGKKSAIFRWISPFSRMAYEFTNQGGTQMVGTIPGGSFLAQVDPGVRATLRGEQGEAAKLMLESNLATGMGTLMAFTGLAWTGMVQLTTATNKYGEQSNALVIKPPVGQGVEINIEKLDPIAFPLGVMASITNQFRDGQISEGRYMDGMIAITADMSKLFLEKGVLLGLSEFTTLLDSRNYNQGWAISAGNFLGTLTGSGTLRMARDWYDPYRRSLTVKDKPFDNFLNAWARRLGVDIVNPPPPLTNPYLNEPMMKNVTPSDANFEERIGAGMAQTLIGLRMTPRTIDDPIIKEVQKRGYEMNPKFYQQAPGTSVPFEDATQQAIYSADLADPQYGNLRGRLEFLFNSKEYKQMVKLYEKARKLDGPGVGPFPSPEGERASNYRQQLKGMISDVHTQAGKAAIENGRLRDWYLQNKREELELMGPMSDATGQTDGLYAQAAREDNPLAQQVRAILDIA